MLIGKKHKIHRALKPLCLSIHTAIKKAYDGVAQPDSLRAIDTRDAVLSIQSEIDKVLLFIETRKWKKEAVNDPETIKR